LRAILQRIVPCELRNERERERAIDDAIRSERDLGMPLQ
jgi:hypothetical protein